MELSLFYLKIGVLIVIILLLKIFKPKIKGIIGEKTISAILSRLDSDKYKIINDVMVECNGKTSQIDHVIVSNYGIFVIETKNYKGWIYGSEKSKYWTQVIYKRKEKLYNPLWQNHGHVKALEETLSDFKNLTFIPLVVFSVQADFKKGMPTGVVYSVNLLRNIKEHADEVISDRKKELIYSQIVSFNIHDKEKRKMHVQTIRENKAKNNQKSESDVCPKCGGKLVIRKGKYGDFIGCRNYPKCRYTEKTKTG